MEVSFLRLKLAISKWPKSIYHNLLKYSTWSWSLSAVVAGSCWRADDWLERQLLNKTWMSYNRLREAISSIWKRKAYLSLPSLVACGDESGKAKINHSAALRRRARRRAVASCERCEKLIIIFLLTSVSAVKLWKINGEAVAYIVNVAGGHQRKLLSQCHIRENAVGAQMHL